jgi:hypothetical protein
MSKRITIRFNDKELAQLELFKKTYGIVDDNKAIKLGLSWVNNYLRNVTQLLLPPDYDIVLYKKTVRGRKGTRIYEE